MLDHDTDWSVPVACRALLPCIYEVILLSSLVALEFIDRNGESMPSEARYAYPRIWLENPRINSPKPARLCQSISILNLPDMTIGRTVRKRILSGWSRLGSRHLSTTLGIVNAWLVVESEQSAIGCRISINIDVTTFARKTSTTQVSTIDNTSSSGA